MNRSQTDFFQTDPAVDLWKQHHPDMTLLDLRMPELASVGAIKEIREHDENARIIVLTTFDGDEDNLPRFKLAPEVTCSRTRRARH